MKKLICCLVAMLLCMSCVFAVGCGAPKLEISDKTLSMQMFEEKTVTLDTELTDAITWTSSDTAKVVVEGNAKSAKVIAVGAGDATVTAKVGAREVKCDVTVASSQDELVLSASIDSQIVTIGSTKQITSSVSYKENAFSKAKDQDKSLKNKWREKVCIV